MGKDITREFISAFYILMDLVVISYGKSNNIALGILTGKDEKIDDVSKHLYFSWNVDKTDDELISSTQLCEFLLKQNLVSRDKILISEQELIKRMVSDGWSLSKARKTIGALLSIAIGKVYDDEITGSFSLHF